LNIQSTQRLGSHTQALNKVALGILQWVYKIELHRAVMSGGRKGETVHRAVEPSARRTTGAPVRHRHDHQRRDFSQRHDPRAGGPRDSRPSTTTASNQYVPPNSRVGAARARVLRSGFVCVMIFGNDVNKLTRKLGRGVPLCRRMRPRLPKRHDQQ